MIPLGIIAALSCGAWQKHFYNLLIHVYWPTDLTINIDLRSLSAAAQYNHIFHAGQQPESPELFCRKKKGEKREGEIKGPILNRCFKPPGGVNAYVNCLNVSQRRFCVFISSHLKDTRRGRHKKKKRFISGASLQKSRLKGKELRHGWEIKDDLSVTWHTKRAANARKEYSHLK